MSFSSAVISRMERHALAHQDFVLITNNCWGSDIYPTLGRPYNTPFVGLYLPGPSYINLLTDFDKKVAERLTFVSRSPLRDTVYPFPVALLGDDVEVHFMHYASPDEAREKWLRRLDRLHHARAKGAPLRVKFCDRDPENAACMARFHDVVPGAKVSFGVRDAAHANHLRVPADKAGSFVPVGPRLYTKRYQYFDFCEWLKSGSVRHTPRSRLLSLMR